MYWFPEASPAYRGGLRPGDWLLAIDERPIPSVDALQQLLARDQVGQSLQIRALRGRDRLSLVVVPEVSAS